MSKRWLFLRGCWIKHKSVLVFFMSRPLWKCISLANQLLVFFRTAFLMSDKNINMSWWRLKSKLLLFHSKSYLEYLVLSLLYGTQHALTRFLKVPISPAPNLDGGKIRQFNWSAAMSLILRSRTANIRVHSPCPMKRTARFIKKCSILLIDC